MENNIPTAEEFAWDKIDFQTALAEMNYQEVYYLMQEFAKLHVEAALKSAYDNIEYTTVDSSVPYVVEESIITSYPLTNIK
jgi:hypothetical protein